MNKYIERWFELCARFDAMVVRERMLLFGSCLAGIYLVFDTLMIMPTNTRIEELNVEVAALEKTANRISSEKQVFDRVSQRDPDADIKREQLKLQGKLLKLESELDNLSLRLVPSERLPEILEGISQNAEKVKLKAIQTLPSEAIDLVGKSIKLASLAEATQRYLKDDEDESVAPVNTKDAVYRHGIVVELQGGFFQIMQFLKDLESLKWRFYWERIDYQVDTFPLATARIELYTLSTDEGMLGGY